MSFDSSDEDDLDQDQPPPPKFKFQIIPKASETGVLLISGLPGAKYRETRRRLEDDLEVLKEEGIDCIVPLVTLYEMRRYKVSKLLSKYKENGFDIYHCPIEDGLIPGQDQASKLILWIQEALTKGKKLLVHCFGGFGRAGLVAACAVILQCPEMSRDDVIAYLRGLRGPRTIQSVKQYNFIQEFCLKCPNSKIKNDNKKE